MWMDTKQEFTDETKHALEQLKYALDNWKDGGSYGCVEEAYSIFKKIMEG